ncbi:MAG: putative MAPEG superfamily protein [Cellvibrionaceae bacterium]|jgi:uncharacterized MAPEG superfamily protein
MKVAIICLNILILLPISLTWITAYFRKSQLGIIDNNNPRAQYAQLQGVAGRLVAAQANTWEAIIFFMASILAVHIAGVDPKYIVIPCITFVICRVLFIIAYVANQGVLRSLIFIAGAICCFYMFYIAYNSEHYLKL